MFIFLHIVLLYFLYLYFCIYFNLCIQSYTMQSLLLSLLPIVATGLVLLQEFNYTVVTLLINNVLLNFKPCH